MFDVDMYMNGLVALLLERFGDRLVYVGLQGSYMRGEATPHSDIDPMVVIDGLGARDLLAYRACVQALPNPELSCGFLCGRDELAHWNPLELCHLLHTTRDIYGALAPLLPAFSEADARNYVKLSIGNLYHEAVHRYVHRGDARSREALPGMLKGAFFILQNAYYLETGVFAENRRALMPLLREEDRKLLAVGDSLDSGEIGLTEAMDTLLGWSRDWLNRV